MSRNVTTMNEVEVFPAGVTALAEPANAILQITRCKNQERKPNMLVLTRKKNEWIVIADHISVHVLETSGGRVKIGIEAPSEVPIRRAEFSPDATDSQQRSASTGGTFD